MTQPVTPDRSDLIVGTMRPPAWLARVPRPVWLFVALAVLDVVVRLTFFGSFGPLSPSAVVSIVLSLTQPAVLVALPGAVLVGRHDGPPGRGLFFGGLLLMLAEGVFLGAQVLDRGLAAGNGAAFDTFAAVRFVAAIAALAGVVFLATGIRSSARGATTVSARRAAVLLAAIAIGGAILDLVVLAGYVSRGAPDPASLVSPIGIVGNGVGIVTGVVWGLLAAAAVLAWSTSGDRGLGLVAAGTATVVVSGAISTMLTLSIFSSPAAIAAIGEGVYLAIFQLSVALRALGLGLVLVGLAVGFAIADREVPEEPSAVDVASLPA